MSGFSRVNLFYRVLSPIQQRTRRRRMKWFLDFIGPAGPKPLRVLDLGGQPETWAGVPIPLDITMLNLPGIMRPPVDRLHRYTYIVGNACSAPFPDQSFDIVFSNSVIEHVGDESHQAAFAAEVHRLARRYWIQTPSRYFPIEAHCGMPLWWFYPPALRERFKARWRQKLPEWTDMIDGTRVLTRSRLVELFPNATICTERLMGFAKSYVARSVQTS